MEITCNNFKEIYRDLENVVKKASFVAVDVEFLGLDPEDSTLKCSLFDSPADRYRKQRASVQRFPPIQLGIAFFTAHDSGFKYKVDVYNVFLFKNGLSRHECSFSVASLAFLESHGFDFNKLISEGVSHLNLDEQKKALDELTSKNDTARYFSHEFQSLFEHIQSILHSKLAKIRRKTTGSEGARDLIWEEFHILIGETEMSPLHNAFLLYKLYATVPGIRLDITGNLLTCSPVRPSLDEVKEKKADLLKTAVNELAGASDIVMAIIENRLPIIGHNCLFDLLYLYQHFIADLPDDYEKFKEVATAVFPIVIDTKILAEESKNQLSWHGIVDFRLENLSSFCESEAPSRLGTFPTFEYSHGFSVTGRTSRRNKYKRTTFHNAAYDALVTGQAFVKLGHLIAKPSGNPSPLPFRTLLYTVRPFACRIPVPLLCIPYINLLGMDPPPRYPEEIVLEVIVEEGLDSLHKDLRAQFGRWRCEAKIDGLMVRLATNTDTTYRRVFNFYAYHPSFRVVSSTNSSSTTSLSDGSDTASSCSSTTNISTPNKDCQIRPRSYSVSSNDSQGSKSQYGLQKRSDDGSTLSTQGSPMLRWVLHAGTAILSSQFRPFAVTNP
ncbi:unnamed protein product, partial [Mesorhabditis belari]|uniref:Poly(A)-specific ribonuclease PARN n=1 Tax=Mesorhabditis belari TaxID=2138241 RepID=A0AAF3FNW7_9BILA